MAVSLISVQSGALWAMGSNSDGQLGVGRNPEWTSVPIQIHGTAIIMMINDDHGNHDDDDGNCVPIQIDGTAIIMMILMINNDKR